VLSPISLEEEAFLKKVDDIYSRLDSMDYFELLRVGESADSDTIRQSYYALAKEFHPDRFYDTSDPTLRDKLSRIFDALTDAFNTLKDEEGRLSYLASLGRSSTPADTEKAESNYKKSIELIKAGRHQEAVSLCEEAVRIEPKEARYWNLLALAYSKIDGRTDDAEKALLEALMLEPANSEYYSNLGLIYMKAKRLNEAKNQFQKALALDPKNQKAKKALEKIT
jgi:curved DNA-binding protein CbpA